MNEELRMNNEEFFLKTRNRTRLTDRLLFFNEELIMKNEELLHDTTIGTTI